MPLTLGQLTQLINDRHLTDLECTIDTCDTRDMTGIPLTLKH